MTDDQTPRTTNVPPDVTRAAVAHQLGVILDSRQPPHRANTAGCLATISGASFVAIIVLAVAFSHGIPGALLLVVRWAFVVLVALGLACLGLSVKTLFTPTRSFFIYERGFVYRSGKRIDAFGWSEVQGLRPGFITRGGLSGKLVRYDILRPGAKPIPVPVNFLKDRDRFSHRLVEIVHSLGRPVG